MMKEVGNEYTEVSYALLIRRYLDDSNLEMALEILAGMESRRLTSHSKPLREYHNHLDHPKKNATYSSWN